MRFRLSTSCLTALCSVALAACGGAPDLPNADTMEFVNFEKSANAGGLTSADQATYANVTQAALSVGLVTAAVNLALVFPRATFAATISTKAQRDGGDWVWKKTFPLLGYESELRANGESGDVNLEMYVSSIRDNVTQLDNFLWYTGTGRGGHGTWEFFAPEKTGPVVQIDWTRNSATDKELSFANVEAESLKQDDTLTYMRKEDLASMAIHDERSGDADDGAAQDYEVAWNLVSGEGKLIRITGEEACWETIENGQVDIACPEGAWPNP